MHDQPHAKQSVYLTDEIYEELMAEAKRLQRSPSWLLQRAWKLARKKVKEMPSQPKEK